MRIDFVGGLENIEQVKINSIRSTVPTRSRTQITARFFKISESSGVHPLACHPISHDTIPSLAEHIVHKDFLKASKCFVIMIVTL